MARNEVRVHASAKDDASKPIDNIKDKLQSLKEDIAKGSAMGVGLAAGAKGFDLITDAAADAGKAVGEFVISSIDKASDLNETMSKAEVIFGSNSKAVEDWAATMDRSAGQSQKAALDAASGFAGLFKTVGLGIDESTQKSEKLTQLGSDLASFFNTDVGDALDSLKSGLNGEAEPLRKFNIFLSDAAVTAELTSMGVKKVGGQFTEAQKATARYNLILDQTGDAQGDFARTSDGLANSQRVTAAEIDNLQAAIGQDLLPVVRDLSNWAKDDGVPALKGLVDVIKEASYQTGGWADENAKATDIVRGFSDGTSQAEAAAMAMDDAMKDITKTMVDFRAGERGSWQEMAKVSDKAWMARDRIKGLGGAAQKAADDFRELRQDVNKAAQAVAEAAYGPEQLRLEFQKNELELRDNQDELTKTQKKIKELGDKGKPIPRELREKFIDLKSSVDDNKQSLIETGIKLHNVNGISMADLREEFRKSHINLSNLTGDAKLYWEWLNKAANVNLNNFVSGGSSKGGHATGGTIGPNEWSTVGEKGMELAHGRPGGGVDIFPLTGTATAGFGGFLGGGGAAPSMSEAPAGGGGMSFHLHVSTPLMTPGSAQALADAIAPHLTRWQQSRGLVPR